MPFANLLRAAAIGAALALAACGDDGEPTNETTAPGPTAAGHEAVPSCYAALDIAAPPAPERAVFVLVDQTTGLDPRLRATVTSNLERLLRPGSRFTVATFSALSREHFPTVIASGTLEAPLNAEQRLHLAARKVEEMEACLQQQHAFAIEEAGRRVLAATAASTSTFTNSEIMGSLRQLAQAVRGSPANDRIVILVSDMLEHSDAASFYADRRLRLIDPAQEMEKAERHDLLADFGGADFVVVGAGLLSPEAAADAGRATAELNALRAFWTQWLGRSNAELVAWGQPDLVAPIR